MICVCVALSLFGMMADAYDDAAAFYRDKEAVKERTKHVKINKCTGEVKCMEGLPIEFKDIQLRLNKNLREKAPKLKQSV